MFEEVSFAVKILVYITKWGRLLLLVVFKILA